MINWVRPSGSIIETKDTPELREFAKSAGWKEVEKPRNDLEKRINLSETKDELKEHLDAINLSVDMRGSLDKVKSKAITVLRGRDGDSSNSHS